MINANMKTYNYFTLGAANEYGQQTISEKAQGTVKISINLVSQNVADNIKYKDSTYIGLTLDNSINDSYIIEYGEEKLKVLYVNPFGRYKQVFLSEL